MSRERATVSNSQNQLAQCIGLVFNWRWNKGMTCRQSTFY